jgi:ferredoxin
MHLLVRSIAAAAEDVVSLELVSPQGEPLPPFSGAHEAAVAGGFEVMHACREGVCGACQTVVVEDEPDHRDSYLSPRERSSGKTMRLCCSGSKSDVLVLDL